MPKIGVLVQYAKRRAREKNSVGYAYKTGEIVFHSLFVEIKDATLSMIKTQYY